MQNGILGFDRFARCWLDFVLAGFLTFACGMAFAASSQYPANFVWIGYQGVQTSSADAACATFYTRASPVYQSAKMTSSTAASCMVTWPGYIDTPTADATVSAKYVCNPGDTGPLSGNICTNTCYPAAGYSYSATTTTAPDYSCPVGGTAYTCNTTSTNSKAGGGSSSNCVVACSSAANGSGGYTGTLKWTGDSCDPGTYSPTSTSGGTASQSTPSSQSTPASSSSTPSTSSSGTSSSGSSSGTSGGTGTDSGSSTSTSQSGTSTSQSGTSAGSTSQSNTPDSSWAENGCNTAPVCSGDAIQCAQANEEWQARCAWVATDAQKKIYDAAVANGKNGDADNPALEANWGVSDIGTLLSSADTEMFSSSCPADINLNVMGNGIHVSMADACKWLSYFGQVAVAACMVIGMIIIGKQ